VSILNSQADPPTLKNLGFMTAGARFSKNQGLWSIDGVLGLSWDRFGCFWGLLEALLVPLRALGGTLNFQNFFLVLPEAPILAPEEPPTAPSGSPGALMARQMAPRSHQGSSGDAFGHMF